MSAHYTKAQVLAAERVSWADPESDDQAGYSYDGISFWRHARDGSRQLTRASEAPTSGWWHEEDCNCALCSEASAHSGRDEKQALAAERT
jgi:hypothetical protein